MARYYLAENVALQHSSSVDYAQEFLFNALNIGEEMLISGAEVSRVEDSVRRICIAYGAEKVDVFTITSAIVVTAYSPMFGADAKAHHLHKVRSVQTCPAQRAFPPHLRGNAAFRGGGKRA